jgi:hypothetical protein
MRRYWSKPPHQSFERARPRRGWTTDLQKARKKIEDTAMYGGFWPWIQLVEETETEYRVIAEYRNHGNRGWVSPLQAAGFVGQ